MEELYDSQLQDVGSFEMTDLIKVIARNCGVCDLSADTYNEISDSVTFLVKLIVQQSLKFFDKNNHLKLMAEDIRFGMKSMGVEPVFSFISRDPALFKHGRGGNKGCFSIGEKEMDLTDVINAPAPKIPLPCSIKGHWLAIEGIQPAIPENPVPPSETLKQTNKTEDGQSKPKANSSERAPMNEIITFPMTLEQQHYLQEITEACIGPDENRRSEAFESLKVDTGLGVMLPRLCNFIAEGVRVNVGRNNFAMLIYLMRMCKSLVDNSNLRLEAYLHELLPPIITCIVSKQLCLRPEVDNHWALREYAARLLCQVCRTFNTGNNQLRSTVTKILSNTLIKDDTPLTTYYGALFCLGELGMESVINFILPCVPLASERLFSILGTEKRLMSASNVDKIAAERIKSILLKTLPPVILTDNPSNNPQEFTTSYGDYLGSLLYEAVVTFRQQNSDNTQNVVGQVPASIVLGRNSAAASMHQNSSRNSTSTFSPLLSSTQLQQKSSGTSQPANLSGMC